MCRPHHLAVMPVIGLCAPRPTLAKCSNYGFALSAWHAIAAWSICFTCQYCVSGYAGAALTLKASVWAAGAAPAKRARYGPRLTAANYRYIVRGRSEKAAADDVRIAAQRRARLAPYDRDLRQFRRGLD